MSGSPTPPPTPPSTPPPTPPAPPASSATSATSATSEASATSATSATLSFVVTEDDTAVAVGSGSLPVLGTPRLLAWCEAATCAALEDDLREHETSVGTRIDLEHLAASPVGQDLQVSAGLVHSDGRLRRFAVSARHVADGRPGKLVGSGEVTRVIVDREKFLATVAGRHR